MRNLLIQQYVKFNDSKTGALCWSRNHNNPWIQICAEPS